MISYDPLWHLLIDKKMGKLELCKKAGIATSTLAKLGKNENVAVDFGENLPCARLSDRAGHRDKIRRRAR